MNKNLKSLSVKTAIILAAGFFAGYARAEDAGLTQSDKSFMLAAAQGGMTEVKLGELAAQKGMRDDVKDFGELMMKDHSVINADMKALATQKGVTLPDSLDAKHQAIVNRLSAKSGPKFDHAYIAEMVKDHKADAKAFKAESAKTMDPDIKAFLDKSIPVVERHLKHIVAMKK